MRVDMAEFQNAMEIFKLLNKSNCRECNEATCLAFAAAVFQGRKQLAECPDLSVEIISRYSSAETKSKANDIDFEAAMASLQKQIEEVDLEQVAPRVGGVYAKDKLTLKILGKDFSIDTKGNISTDIHVHPWVAGPVFDYILKGGGPGIIGKWVPLRELPGGKDWYRLFGQRCEKPLKKLADTHTDLFEDLVEMFAGQQVERHYESDVSVVLYPLPKVPVLFCYWKPEDGLESDLHIFFDETAEDNLNIESIFTLGTGLVIMFEKISHRHAWN